MSADFINIFSPAIEICFQKPNRAKKTLVIVDPDTYRDAILRVLGCCAQAEKDNAIQRNNNERDFIS
jgi:hypothetical protein